jgi:splicing factor 45
VRYNLPAPSPDIPATEAELEKALEEDEDAQDVQNESVSDEPAQRTNRPGQKGFAERLMAKYGWTKGSGLGASGTGITTALKVKVEKGKNAAGHGKIIGGKRKVPQVEGKFGAMSEVVVLRGMVDGLNLQHELGQDGTLIQEIGEECGEKVSPPILNAEFRTDQFKYGQVQRVFIPRDSIEQSVPVFIHFTNQLSALRVYYD